MLSPVYTFYLAGNIVVHMTIQDKNWQKYFNQNISKGKKPTLAAKNTSLSISSFLNRVFSIFRQKNVRV